MTTSLECIDGVWHGHTERYCMSMSQEIFQMYLSTYMQPQLGVSQEEAMQRVTRLSYWAYAHYDRNIHFVQLPSCILKQEGGR